MMKKILLMSLLLVCSISMWGQAKKPKLMIVPKESWCIKQGYTLTYNDQGTERVVADYKKAFQMDDELNNMITRMGIIMSERGFDLVLMENVIRNMERREAENELLTSNTSGASLAESQYDKIRAQANADILMELEWQVVKTGPKKSITYNLRGSDAYSAKQIAGAQGTGTPSMATELPVMLEEAVTAHMDNFVAQLHSHFENLLNKGREIFVEVRVFEENADGVNFETEYDGMELQEIIENWFAENTVNHSFSFSSGSETILMFDQVMIPLYRPNGSGMSAYNFVNELRKFLRAAPYNLTCKVTNKGLGEVLLSIGEK